MKRKIQIFLMTAFILLCGISVVDIKVNADFQEGNTDIKDPVCETHIWEQEYVVDKPATTSKTGLMSVHCSVCDSIQKESEIKIPKIASIVLSEECFDYSGKKHIPDVMITDIEGLQLVENTDYQVVVEEGQTEVGRYSVFIQFQGKYAGSDELYYSIIPVAPQITCAELYGYDDIELIWEASAGATGYNVYYSKSTDTVPNMKKVETTSCQISNLSDGVKYELKVVPCYDADGEILESRNYSTEEVTTLKKLNLPKVEKYSPAEVKVSGTKITGASGWQLSYSEESGKTANTIRKTSSYEVVEPEQNTTYYYKVRAYKKRTDGKYVYGNWSDELAYNLRYVGEVSEVKLQLYGYDDVEVNWDAVEGANAYDVYYKKSSQDDTDYLLCGENIDTTSCKKSNLSDGVKYTFKVVPKYISDGSVNEEALVVGTEATATIYTLKKLEAPIVTKVSPTEVKVAGKKISGASGFQVSYSKESGVSANTIRTTSSYKVVEPEQNATYYYKVRAYKKVADSKYVYGTWSDEVAYNLRYVAEMSEVKLQLYGYDDVEVTWEEVEGANAYDVYYKKSSQEDTEYVLCGENLEETVCKKANLSDGVKYTFKVVPKYISDGSVNEEALVIGIEASAEIYTLKKVTNVAVDKYSSTKVKVSWSKCYGTEGYQISRSTSSTGTANQTTTTSSSKTITPTKNKTYYYKVRAYVVVDGSKVYGPWSSVVNYNLRYVGEIPEVNLELYGYDDVEVTWEAAEGANAYDVYYKKSSQSDSEYVLYKENLADTTCKKSNLSDNVKYTFKVVPKYISDGSVNEESEVAGSETTAEIYTMKKLSAPKVERYSSTQVKVTGTKLLGATGYQISRSTSSTGTANTVRTTSSYKLLTPTKGKTYYYKVRAYKKLTDGTYIYGSWSSVVEFTLE